MKTSTAATVKTMPLDDRIDLAFKGYFDTVGLASSLTQSKANIQEIILLICARPDSLSNLNRTEGFDKDRFINFLANHSSLKKNIFGVSVPDLYDVLCYWLWPLPGFISSPGRLRVFDPVRDRLFIGLLSTSEVPITEQASTDF